MADRPRVILDCDPGHDDAMAILLAGRHTELLGITTVSGNAPLAATTRNALLCTQILEMNVPVHAGADRPLLVPPRHAPQAHGVTGMDGPTLPELRRAPASDDAVGFIIRTVREQPGVWLVPIGPLTNIALAIRAAPDIVPRLAGIVLMGGSATVGNVTPVAEFNLWADPHAAAIVFAAGAPLAMCGLNLTHQFWVDDVTIAELRAIGNVAGRFAADLFAFYIDGSEARTGARRAPLHDPCAVLALTHPEVLSGSNYCVEVETHAGLTRGMTVIDKRRLPAPAAPNCLVYETIDRAAAMTAFLTTVADYS